MTSRRTHLLRQLTLQKRTLRKRIAALMTDMNATRTQLTAMEKDVEAECCNLERAVYAVLVGRFGYGVAAAVVKRSSIVWENQPALDSDEDVANAKTILRRLREAQRLLQVNYEMSQHYHHLLAHKLAVAVIASSVVRSNLRHRTQTRSAVA